MTRHTTVASQLPVIRVELPGILLKRALELLTRNQKDLLERKSDLLVSLTLCLEKPFSHSLFFQVSYGPCRAINRRSSKPTSSQPTPTTMNAVLNSWASSPSHWSPPFLVESRPKNSLELCSLISTSLLFARTFFLVLRAHCFRLLYLTPRPLSLHSARLWRAPKDIRPLFTRFRCQTIPFLR